MDLSNLPAHFPKYTVQGESILKEDFCITPHTSNYEEGFLFVADYQGKLKWYKELPAYAYSFRKIQYADGTIRYAYQQVERQKERCNGCYDDTHVVLMDENFQVIRDHIKLLKHGSLKDVCSCENHEYKVLGDDHYLLTAVVATTVHNIPGIRRGVRVFNSIIQEQKDGKVVFQFESIDHPELYETAIVNHEYKNYTFPRLAVSDYAHLNSITFDPDNGDLAVSYRSIGLLKISRKTGKVLWVMGRGRNDIAGMEESQLPLYQHDVFYNEDRSITIFDNWGCPDDYSRICRYWIDEENKKLDKFQELRCPKPRSPFMGSSRMIDEENDVYDIAYGGNFKEAPFEEYDFKNGRSIMTLTFEDGHDLFQINHGAERNPV